MLQLLVKNIMIMFFVNLSQHLWDALMRYPKYGDSLVYHNIISSPKSDTGDIITASEYTKKDCAVQLAAL